MNKLPLILLFGVLLLATLPRTSYAQGLNVDSIVTTRIATEIETEYYAPKGDDRDIRTAVAAAFLGIQNEVFHRVRISCYGGLIMNYAWGSITQWNEHFRDSSYENHAFGLGPAYLIRLEGIITKDFAIGIEQGVGLILYTNAFPVGGDIYNFMLRVGALVAITPWDTYAVTAGARWMHVSNGQGLTPSNPSYEAIGGYVGLIKYF